MSGNERPAAGVAAVSPSEPQTRVKVLQLAGTYADRAITQHFGWPWHGDAQKLYAAVFDTLVEFAGALRNDHASGRIGAREWLAARGQADLSLYWPTTKPLPQIDYESGEAKPTLPELMEAYAAAPAVPPEPTPVGARLNAEMLKALKLVFAQMQEQYVPGDTGAGNCEWCTTYRAVESAIAHAEIGDGA